MRTKTKDSLQAEESATGQATDIVSLCVCYEGGGTEEVRAKLIAAKWSTN